MTQVIERPLSFDVYKEQLVMSNISGMCSGGYQEKGRSLAPKGTMCEHEEGKNPCIYAEGNWGASYCITNSADKDDGWGAECVPCSGIIKWSMYQTYANM